MAYTTEQLGDTINFAHSDQVGSTLAINAAGGRVAATAPKGDGQADYAGYVTVWDFLESVSDGSYLYGEDGWNQVGGMELYSVLGGPNAKHVGGNIKGLAAGDLGNSYGPAGGVSINAAGDVVAVGSHDASPGGTVRVFRFDPTATETWTSGSPATDVTTYDGGIGRGKGQWRQIGGAITGTGESSDWFGQCIKLNAAGNVIVISEHGYDHDPSYPQTDVDDVGRIRVFYLTGATGSESWSQMGSTIEGTDEDDQFGGPLASHQLDINDVGDVIIFTEGDAISPAALLGPTGVRAYRFTGDPSSGSWSQLGSTLTFASISGSDYDRFGFSCALNAHGNVIVVGAPGEDSGGNYAGCALTYKWNASTPAWDNLGWSGSTPPIMGGADKESLGTACSINGEGDIVLVGAFPDSDGTPVQYSYFKLYKYNGSSWSQIGDTVFGPEGGDLPYFYDQGYFGTSCDLNYAGDRFVVADAHDGASSAAKGDIRTYSISELQPSDIAVSPPDLTQIGSDITPGYGSHDIDANDLCTRIAVGRTTANSDEGDVQVYGHALGSTAWTQIGSNITENGGTSGDNFGTKVRLNAAGNILLVGHYKSDSKDGKVQVFRWDPFDETWDFLDEITGVTSDGAQFGRGIAINAAGDIIAVGLPDHDGALDNAGQVKIYRFGTASHSTRGMWDGAGGSYQLEQTILPPSSDDTNPEWMGTEVALNAAGDQLAVSHPAWDNPGGYMVGRITIWNYNGPLESTSSAWELEAGDSTNTLEGTNWRLGGGENHETATTHGIGTIGISTAGGIRAGDGYYKPSIVVAGEPGEDTGGTDRGGVAVFSNQPDRDGTWRELGSAESLAGSSQNNSNFGAAVGINGAGSWMAVGEPGYDAGAGAVGRVYLYHLEKVVSTWTWVERKVITGSSTSYPIGGGSKLCLNWAGDKVIFIATDWNATTSGRISAYQLSTPPDASPTVANAISDVAVSEDAANTTIDITNVFTDSDNDDSLITKTASSSNTGLVTAVTSSTNGNTLTLDYVADRPLGTAGGTDTATITVTGTSNVLTVNDTFLVTVTAVNDAISVTNPIADFSVNEDAADTTIDLTNTFADADVASSGDVTKAVQSNSNTGLVTATIESSNTLRLAYTANANGSATITIRGTAVTGDSVDEAFVVTVNAVQDGPVVANPLPSYSRHVNRPDQTISLTNVFSDPEGDAITKTVQSISPNNTKVDASIVGDTLTLTYPAWSDTGDTTITIRGTSTGGYIDNSFVITIENNAPVLVSSGVGTRTATIGDGNMTIDLSNLYTDPDYPTYQFQGAPSNSAIVKTIQTAGSSSVVIPSISASPGNTLTLNFQAIGTTSVTIRATSEGQYYDDTFTVEVENVDQLPTVNAAISDVTKTKNHVADHTIDLTNVFTDPDGTPTNTNIVKTIYFNGNPNLVTASIAGNTLTLNFLRHMGEVGYAEIGVRGDSNGKYAYDYFTVIVNSSAPTVASAILDVSVAEDAANTTIDLTSVFTDADLDYAAYVDDSTNTDLASAYSSYVSGGSAATGPYISNLNKAGWGYTHWTNYGSGEARAGLAGEASTKTASSSDTSLVTASVAGETLTLDYQTNQFGTATITVTATDPDGGSLPRVLSAEDAFDVTVASDGLAEFSIDKLTAIKVSTDEMRDKVNEMIDLIVPWSQDIDSHVQSSSSVAASVGVLTGTIANGGTIPLPAGFTQAECKWMVSVGSVSSSHGDHHASHNLTHTADASRVVTTTGIGGGSGTANYIIIGIK
jgi:hypothetical protein